MAMLKPSKYDQLHRDIVISSDIYGGLNRKPRILAAGYGFEGIQGIPGLNSVDNIELAIKAGAGVVAPLIDLLDVPLRNITSGISLLAVSAGAGFSDKPVLDPFMDAMPIEFSHPVLPSTVLPENFEIVLNTGQVVMPKYVALNPNYDFNERQTVVAFGYFGNRLPSNQVGAVHPVTFRVVSSANPLKLVTPDGLFEGSGLSKESSNPYDPFNGPTLVGAKLSKLSLAGDYGPDGFTGSEKNHGVEYYGTSDELYRLRLFTSGGFSPDGVTGLRPDQFSDYFQLTAKRSDGEHEVTLSVPDKWYRVQGGRIKILGIADLGPGLSADPGYTYAEDHDNQFDVIVRASSLRAVESLQSVILPDPREKTHKPIYNPGGPGTAPLSTFSYTQPSPGQIIDIEKAIKNPNVVSYASQKLSDYDEADGLAAVFRLRDPVTGSMMLTASSAAAASAVRNGEMEFVDVPFSANSNDSFSKPVFELEHPKTGDLAYAIRAGEKKALLQDGYVFNGEVFAAYPKSYHGLDPIWQLQSVEGMHITTAVKSERDDLIADGWSSGEPVFWSVAFDNVI